ncbi:MAG: hypothetical protein CEE38_10270 [Planctomycetes bacterium B3_Pla]|nr:MAG: hypothetical protein CEE38_10270 [Planctomycetes bacterium B3_Pla]
MEFFLFFLRQREVNYRIMEKIRETRLLFKHALLSGEQAHQLLQTHYQKANACIAVGLGAWQGFQKCAKEKCVALTSCTIAGIIHNHMVYHARKVFSGMEPDVMLTADAGFLVVDFYGKIKLRFKKLSNELRPYNVKTHQQRACDDQTLFAGPATLVTAGYRLNSVGSFRDAHIVCWAGSELRWSLRLPGLDEMQQPIESAPDSSVPPVVVAKKVKIDRERAKRSV